MRPSTSIPAQIAGYAVFPLSLPSMPSFPTPATHYLYLGPHQPKTPTPTASRALFLVNIPFDSTEIHIRHLFSSQLDLPAGRIEDVQFEGQRRKAHASEQLPSRKKNNKKRKRDSEAVNMQVLEGPAFPATWDRDLQTNGLTAIVTFVDRTSMDIALKAVKAFAKQGRQPVWGEGVEDKVPPLGSARTAPCVHVVGLF